MKKIDKLLFIYQELSSFFKKTGDSKLIALARSFDGSIEKVKELMSSGVKSSIISSGFEQGLVEMPSVIYGMNYGAREDLIVNIFDVVDGYIPDFYEKQYKKIEKICEAGIIKKESEYMLVRFFIDIMESGRLSEVKLSDLYDLIASYEENN